MLGGGGDFSRYGFRRAPFAYRLCARTAYAPGITRARGEIDRLYLHLGAPF